MAITTEMRTQVAQLYTALFGRAPESAGLGYWVTALGNGTSLATVAQQMFATTDARVYYPSFLTNQEIVAKFYVNVLGRTADAAGLTYWTTALNGAKDAGTVIAQMIVAVTSYNGTDAAALQSQSLFNNKTDVALYYGMLTGSTVAGGTSVLAGVSSDAATVVAAKAAADLIVNPPAVGQTFTLTTGIDNLVGTAGNDTFVAADVANVASWTSLDKIDGGAGNNTFTVAQAANIGGVPAGFTIANIQTVNLVSSGSITANTAAWTGVNTLNITDATGSSVTTAATTDVNELNSTAVVGLTGGKNVTVVHGTAGAVTVADAAGTVNVTSTIAGQSVTVTQVNTATGAETIAAKGNITAGGTSLNASIIGAVARADQAAQVTAASAAVTAHTAATTADTNAGTVVTDLATMATSVAAATTVTANNAATLIAYNAHEITLAQKVAIDTAFATGLVTDIAHAKAAALVVETPITAAAAAAKIVTAAAVLTAAAADTAAATVVATNASNFVADVANAAAKVVLHTTATTNDTVAGAKVTNLATLSAAIAVSTTDAAVAAATAAAVANLSILAGDKVAIDAAGIAGAANVDAGELAAVQALIGPLQTAATAAKVITAAALVTAAANDVAAAAVVTADLVAVPAITVTDIANTALASVTVAGNYTGTTTVTDSSVLHTSLTTATLSNTGDTTFNTANALTNVSVSNNNHSVTINNTTAGHTQNLTLSNVSAGTITDTAATTLSITSNGTSNTVVLTAGAVTAASIVGAGSFSSSLTGLNAAAVITATTSTGANTVTVGVAQSYLGGSGVDKVTTGATLQTAAVSGGAGTADKLTITNAANIDITGAAGTGAAEYSGFEVLQSTGSVVDVSTFTNSTFTSVVSSGSTTFSGLNATQAANVTVLNSGTDVLVVTGATTVGQLDTVHITANDGSSTVSTIVLTAPSIAGVETLNLTAVDNLTVSALTGATAITALNVDGGGIVNITTGNLALNVNTVIDAHLATGVVTIDAHLATTNPLRIVGSATAANTLTAQNGSFADVITGGNGGDTILGGTAGSGNTGALTITAGNGNNTITATGGGVETITVGNGYNAITTGAVNDIITVGTGGNVITSGAGADTITLGAHVFGTTDTLVFGASATVAGAANMDTITGFVSGADTIQLTAGAGAATSLGFNLTAGSAVTPLLAAVTDTTSVATTAAVFAQLITSLNGGAGHEYGVSADGAIVAREVIFTTGAAAGTYLVINDNNAGFGANDIVIKLVGNTTVVAHDITVV